MAPAGEEAMGQPGGKHVFFFGGQRGVGGLNFVSVSRGRMDRRPPVLHPVMTPMLNPH